MKFLIKKVKSWWTKWMEIKQTGKYIDDINEIVSMFYEPCGCLRTMTFRPYRRGRNRCQECGRTKPVPGSVHAI